MKARVLFCIAALSLAGPLFAQAPLPHQKGQLRLPELASLADKASETINVTLDSTLLGIAGRFLDVNDPAEANARKLIGSLTGIYVRSFTFDEDFAYPKADVEGVRRQLSAPGWTRMVQARSRKENTDVDIYMHIDQGRAMGLAIIASEPREFTIVNIVGNIDLEQLHHLEGNFGIPKLGIESGTRKPE